VADVVQRAWRLGARFDGWTECFDRFRWQQAAEEAGVDMEAYLAPRNPADPLPWDGLLAAVDRDFLRADWERAQRGETLSDCRLGGECYACSACAAPPEHRFARTQGEGAAADGGDEDVPPTAARIFDPRNAARGDSSRERDCWQSWRRQAAEKCWYRVEYARDGDLRFLGHLDFQRQMQLALRRSGLPLAYSQGYHPHLLLRFGPPLPVGVAGAHEFCDIAFTGQVAGWERTLNACLPAGLKILRSIVSGTSVPRSIDQATERLEYRVVLPPVGEGGPEAPFVRERVAAFLESARGPTVRRRPKGDIEVDARPLVPPGGLEVQDGFTAVARGSAGTELGVLLMHDTGKPGLPVQEFLAALLGDALPEPQLSMIERTGCYGRGPAGQWRTPFEEVGESHRSFWLRKRLSA
jgi:radical SAM-linked protein